MNVVQVDNEIILKQLGYEDAQCFFDVMNENRTFLEKFMPRISESKSVDDVKNVINLFNKQISNNNGFRMGIFYHNRFVGIIGLKYIDWLNEKTEVMFWVDKAYNGKGIGSRSLKKIIEITFEQLKLNKIIGKSSKLNIHSQKMMEKCGLLFECILIEDEKLQVGFSDSIEYYITKKIYKEGKK